MTRDEALGWLFSTRTFGIKLGLDNVRALLSALGDPHRAFPSMHVAGTNGKGSVCAFLDAGARAAGLRCGLYTSPHLVDFEERIRVGGEKISRDAVAEGLTRLRAIGEKLPNPATFFEYATVLAFDWFARTGCELAVIETGMGGRLDATNVIDPLVSVITPIDLDHSEWLGPTREAIAREKAGIFKPGRPVVSARQLPEVEAVLAEEARRTGSALSICGDPLDAPLGLRGPHQKFNAALALSAFAASGLGLPPAEILRGFASARWPGRFEVRATGHVLDGAHNPHSARALADAWRGEFGEARAPVIFGCLSDKDASGILAAIEPLASRFLFVPVRESTRAVPPSAFCGMVRVPAQVCESLADALAAAPADPVHPTLITGSLFLVGEAISLLP